MFLIRWYKKDGNMLPPTYVLDSISTHLPDFVSTNKDKQKVAKAQWYEECEQMQNTLEETAKHVFNSEQARKYIMSGISFLCILSLIYN